MLTKPIGTGVVTTAIKADAAPSAAVDEAAASMTRLNDAASAALVASGIRACTDVTGFGLLGHLHRMLMASGVAAAVDASAVPLLDHASALAEAGHVSGGTRRNIEALEGFADWGSAPDLTRVMLCDAQTSGGLLAACPPERADDVVSALEGELAAAVIGHVTDGRPGTVSVTGTLG